MSNLVNEGDEDEFDPQQEDNEDGSEGEICPSCNGDGQVFSQNGDDENDRDFEQCAECGGSGCVESRIIPNVEDGDDYTDIDSIRNRLGFDS